MNKEERLWLVQAICMCKNTTLTLLAQTVHVCQSKKLVHSKIFYLAIVMIETRDPSMGGKPSTIELHQKLPNNAFLLFKEKYCHNQ